MLKVYLRVLSMLAPEGALAMALGLANVVLAGVLFLEPWLFGRVVDSLITRSQGLVGSYIGAWAGVGLFGVVASAWVSLHSDRLAHRRRLTAITQYLEHAVALPLSFHDAHHTGRLLRIMNSGSSNLFGIWLGFLREHLATGLAILVTLPVTLRMNWKLALLLAALLVGFAVFHAVAMRRTSRAQDEIEKLHHEVSEQASDLLGNAMIVQSFTRQEVEAAGIRALTQRVLAAQYPVLWGWAWLSVATRFASTLTIVSILLLGAALNDRGEITVGAIATFIGYAMTMIGRLEQFTGFVSTLFLQTPVLRDFFAILDTASTIEEDAGAPDLPPVKGEVVFEDVSFGYTPTQAALRRVSFRAPAGSTVALVGPTGAGKSTALSLLYRACDPSGGRITIDGIDIRSVSLRSLRGCTAVVFQDAGLLYRSIADNLLVGNPSASREQLEAVARAAEAHDFIVVKPEGYATRITERGRSLSGGERQRLAIARAMLKDAPILILDEATSALDSVTEARVQSALAALRRGRTTFVIAHRLSTIRDADLILVLEKGEIVERGCFDELLRRNGLFAELSRQRRFADDVESNDSEQSAVATAISSLSHPPPPLDGFRDSH